VKKSYLCHEADPDVWGGIQLAGLRLLRLSELDRYRELIPDKEDLQDEWEAAIEDPGKCVTLLVGQMDDEEQRAEKDEENYHDCTEWEQTTKNYYLSYHEVKAHLRWVASRPAEAEAYKRFQVSNCVHRISFFDEPIAHSFNNVQVWYSQQADEGKAPGYPMGFGQYRSIEPVRVVGNAE
jgi:hypothetical protein